MGTFQCLKFNPDYMILDFTQWAINNNNFKRYFSPVLEMSSQYNTIQLKITASIKKVHVINIILSRFSPFKLAITGINSFHRNSAQLNVMKNVESCSCFAIARTSKRKILQLVGVPLIIFMKWYVLSLTISDFTVLVEF